jgi:hypothetical protein
MIVHYTMELVNATRQSLWDRGSSLQALKQHSHVTLPNQLSLQKLQMLL